MSKKKQQESSQTKDVNNKNTPPGGVLSDLDKAHLQRWLSMQKSNVLTKSNPPQRPLKAVSVVKSHTLSQDKEHGGEREEIVGGQKIINRVNSNNKTHNGEALIKTFTNMVPKIEGNFFLAALK